MSEEVQVNSVMKKLLKARGIIKNSKLKKKGKNTYSDYEYFTPDQVAKLVDKACQDVGLISIFSLDRDEIGYFGRLTTLDVETGHSIESIMRTEIPEIKATNATQKMGGAYTYTKRYMLMNEYDIADNSLDFDAQDNRPSAVKEEADAKPRKLLKKKVHKSVEEPAKAEEVEEPKAKEPEKEEVPAEEPAPAEPTELDMLKAKADEYGLEYSGRLKETGLKKLIAEHEADLEALAKAESEEVEEEAPQKEDPYAGEPVEEVEAEAVLDVQHYIDMIHAYDDIAKLSKEAKLVYNEAKEAGLPEDDLESIKEAANEHFTALKEG